VLARSGVAAVVQQTIPSQPMHLYGTVQVNETHVITGTLVSAWCSGAQVAQTAAFTTTGYSETWYQMDVPAATDPNGGCASGETVSFRIDALPAPQTVAWSSASGSVEQPLTSTLAVAVNKQISSDGVTWVAADTREAALPLEAGDPLTWRIAITNTSPVTVALLLTDTLQRGPSPDLYSVCDPVPPATLGAAGAPSAAFACELGDAAQAGTRQNALHAEVSAGAFTFVGMDVAHYAVALNRIYIPLVMR
jgi:hypothetical protein